MIRTGQVTMTVGELIDRLVEIPSSSAPVCIDADFFDRIRQCICGEWFFAANSKRLTCSDYCRWDKYVSARESRLGT